MKRYTVTRAHIYLILVVLLAARFGSDITPALAQEPFRVDLAPYGNGPVLPKGYSGEWDAGFVMSPKVLYHDGLFHMLYIGGENLAQRKAVGYAVSVDGRDWVKHWGNPVLELDPDVAEYGIFAAVPWVEDDVWMLYINPVDHPVVEGGETILLATAAAPTGPWHVDFQPLLQRDFGPDWHARSLEPSSVVPTSHGMALYITGTNTERYTIGRALLTDRPRGSKVTYTMTPYLVATQVFAPTIEDQWDNGYVAGASVIHNGASWEMFYFGAVNGSLADVSRMGIGYAISDDGVVWTRHSDEPVLTLDKDAFPWSPSVVVVDGRYYLYYTIVPFGGVDWEIGVATGTISR